jgi:hypothetical protein
MENKVNEFNALTYDILKENKTGYTKALNFAMSNNDIKNIAITGQYGAGKSTVWNTYKKKGRRNIIQEAFEVLKKRQLKMFFLKLYQLKNVNMNNVITICLGKYEEKNINKNEEESRVERQIINQILAQIKAKKIPLSKYCFEKNASILKLMFYVLLSLLFMGSIFLWIFRSDILSIFKPYGLTEFEILIYSCGAFVVSTSIFLYNFYRKNKIKFSKLTYKGTEAEFTETNNDETILERDMKEIVYLLSSSNTRTVVFEDLDRYDNVDIFIKLKELNFLLNVYNEVNRKRIVKFVYLVKDDLFDSKDRTKFFDFIIPILPVVNSNSSLDILLDLTDNLENKPETFLLRNLSLYLNDMRVIRNIVNEYKIFCNLLPMNTIGLNANKLFAIITLKNVFPKEFQLLLENNGFIREIINKIEEYKKNLLKIKKVEINNFKKDLKTKKELLSREICNRITQLVPEDVELVSNKTALKSVEFIYNWRKNRKQSYNILSNKTKKKYTFDEFLDEFIFSNTLAFGDELDILLEKEKQDLNKARQQLKRLEMELGNINSLKWKTIIREMPQKDKEEIFRVNNSEVYSDPNFGIIRFLLTSGMLNESYWYYMTSIFLENDNSLKPKDVIFMKSFLEEKKLSILWKVESPEKIIKRLRIEDFKHPNILNYRIIKECIKSKEKQRLQVITRYLKQNNKSKQFILILSALEIDEVKKYIDIILEDEKYYDDFKDLLEEWVVMPKINDKNLRHIISYIEDMNIPEFKDITKDFDKKNKKIRVLD